MTINSFEVPNHNKVRAGCSDYLQDESIGKNMKYIKEEMKVPMWEKDERFDVLINIFSNATKLRS